MNLTIQCYARNSGVFWVVCGLLFRPQGPQGHKMCDSGPLGMSDID